MLFYYLFSFVQIYHNDNALFQKTYMFLGAVIEHLDAVKDSIIPTIQQNVGLALLSILIPLAIAILQDALKKKDEYATEEFSVLDMHTILDYVFQIKYLIVFALLIFLPFFSGKHLQVTYDLLKLFYHLLELGFKYILF